MTREAEYRALLLETHTFLMAQIMAWEMSPTFRPLVYGFMPVANKIAYTLAEPAQDKDEVVVWANDPEDEKYLKDGVA